MLEILSDGSLGEVDLNKLKIAFLDVATAADIVDSGKRHLVNIQALGDKEIVDLNKEFRQKDYLPDVLSFDYRQEKTFEMELSGEVVVSRTKALLQAQEKGISLGDEIVYLVIHGLLHVFGCDHKTDEQERKMKHLEEEILKRYTGI